LRYIDPEDIFASLERLPEGWEKWQEEAEKALAEVRAAGGSSETVNAHGDLWRSLKGQLEQVSDGKCWYCESSQHRADNAVDHYRPKNRNRSGEHDGYWWLAFDWRNYRYSCTYCNSRRSDDVKGTSGGKHDNFPLLTPRRELRQTILIALVSCLFYSILPCPKTPGYSGMSLTGGLCPSIPKT